MDGLEKSDHICRAERTTGIEVLVLVLLRSRPALMIMSHDAAKSI